MKAFSMFSGIGGFELGIQMASEDIELIGYSEIDKYAIQVYEKHFSGATNYGNATTIDGEQLPDFDLLVGGFPCQAFSVAGKREGFNETRGTLFFDIARILSGKRPRYLVLENVKGLLSHDEGKTFQTILRVLADLGYGVEWQVLNSKDYSVPQNRERVFIVGHFGNRSPRKVFPITGQGTTSVEHVGQYTAYCIDANYYRGASKLNKGKRQVIFSKENCTHEMLYAIIDKKGKNKNKDIASTITGGAHSGGNHSDMDLLVTPVLTPDRGKKRQNGRRFKEPDDPSFTLTGQDIHGVMLNEITKAKSQANRIYDSDGLATTLRSEGGGLGAKTGLYKVETIAQKVKVRKHEVDVDKLCKLLRESKKISNKEIAENLDVPITMVEHWFRTDASFSIPSAEIWFRLKSLLNITTDEFDLPITEFIEKDNVFDTTNRVYDSNGISATLTATGAETGLYAVVKDGTKKGEATVETGDTVNLSYPNSKTRRGRVGKKIAQTLETSMEQYTIVDKPRILDASHRNEGIREYEDYSPTLNSRDYKEPRYVDEGNGMRIRRLTPTECERLQGFPDGWTEGLSDTQRYKTLGNAVTTTVVKAVIEKLLQK